MSNALKKELVMYDSLPVSHLLHRSMQDFFVADVLKEREWTWLWDSAKSVQWEMLLALP